MPESQDFDGLGLPQHAIVQMVADLAQMDAACAGQSYVRRDRTDIRLGGHELESAFEGFAERVWGSSSVQISPR
jgi:hypothetical protein